MRKIIFYRHGNGKCPIEDYLDTLSDKQVEKVFFILDLIEKNTEFISRKFFLKNLKQRTIFGRSASGKETIFFDFLASLMATT